MKHHSQSNPLMNRFFKGILVLLISAGFSVKAFSQTPSNDQCTGAIPVVAGNSYVGTTVGATSIGDSVLGYCFGTPTSAGVWYVFAGDGTVLTASLNDTLINNAMLWVYTSSTNACGGTFSCAGGNYTTNYYSIISTVVGINYYIFVECAYTPSTFTLSISNSIPLVNDQCSGAIPVVCGSSYPGTTIGATSTGDPVSSCGPAITSPGVWYSFAGTGPTVVASTCAYIGFDSEIHVYTGACGGPYTCITGNDDWCFLASSVTFNTVVGTTYWIFVNGWASNMGNFTLTITCYPPPVNDDCSGAITLFPDTVCNAVAGYTALATQTLPADTACAGAMVANDVWYSFVAASTTQIITVTNTGILSQIQSNLAFEVYSTACGANSLGCTSSNSPYWSSISSGYTGLTIGATYWVRVYSAGYNTFTICVKTPTINNLFVVISSHSNVSCAGGNDGSATATPYGGVPPYTYLWSTGAGTSPTATGLMATFYNVTVHDANNLADSAVVFITQPYFIQSQASLTACDSIVYNGITYYADTAVIQNYSAANGCDSTFTMNLTIYNTPDLNVSVSGSSLSSLALGGYGYQWINCNNPLDSTLQSENNTVFYPTNNGNYAVVINNYGCLDTSACIHYMRYSDVWPGDANNDFIVDNTDLLPIGLYYGQTGYSRVALGNFWQADYCADWGVNQWNNNDLNHVDCNGDGLIDRNDTLAVNLNFSMVHAIVANQPNNWQRTASSTIHFVTSSNTYYAGDMVDVEVWVGDATQPVNNLYGIAFNIYYDASLVQSGSESITYPSSWLGTPNTDAITIAKIDPLATTAYGAEARTNQISADGFGKIADFRFRARTTITTTSYLHLAISNYNAVDASGTAVLFNTTADTLLINPSSSGVANTDIDNSILVSPNPVISELRLESKLFQILNVKIKSVLGEVLLNSETHSQKEEIDLNGFAKGVYFVEIVTEKGKITKKIIKE